MYLVNPIWNKVHYRIQCQTYINDVLFESIKFSLMKEIFSNVAKVQNKIHFYYASYDYKYYV